MEHIWTPWRYTYITNVDKAPGCVFCDLLENNNDRTNLILFRGKFNFIVLNLYPYTSGHVMVIPYQHEASLAVLDAETTTEMMELTKQLQVILQGEYHPDGFNIGLNLGRAAGAGVKEHLHLHIVPRWIGDANFMTAIAEARILPEDLTETYERLIKHFS
jgi:ATP adenylyltransferase